MASDVCSNCVRLVMYSMDVWEMVRSYPSVISSRLDIQTPTSNIASCSCKSAVLTSQRLPDPLE